MNIGERATYHAIHHHPEAGDFYVSRTDRPPAPGLEYFCCGRYYASEEQAVADFDRRCHEADAAEDTTYARMEARMVRPGVFED